MATTNPGPQPYIYNPPPIITTRYHQASRNSIPYVTYGISRNSTPQPLGQPQAPISPPLSPKNTVPEPASEHDRQSQDREPLDFTRKPSQPSSPPKLTPQLPVPDQQTPPRLSLSSTYEEIRLGSPNKEMDEKSPGAIGLGLSFTSFMTVQEKECGPSAQGDKQKWWNPCTWAPVTWVIFLFFLGIPTLSLAWKVSLVKFMLLPCFSPSWSRALDDSVFAAVQEAGEVEAYRRRMRLWCRLTLAADVIWWTAMFALLGVWAAHVAQMHGEAAMEGGEM